MSRTTEPKSNPRTGMKPWLKAVLALSLTLNLLVLGVVVGSWAGDHRNGRAPHVSGRFDPALGPLGRSLSDEARRAALADLNARSEPGRVDRAELARQFRDMVAALRADPYDPAPLETIIAAQSAAWSARSDAGRAAVLRQIETMSPEERDALADRFERGFRHALERKGSRKHP